MAKGALNVMATQEEKKFVKDLADLFYEELWPTLEYQDEEVWENELWAIIGAWLFHTQVASGAHVTLNPTEVQALGPNPTINHYEERIGQISKAAYDAGKYHNRNQFATYILDNGCEVRFG